MKDNILLNFRGIAYGTKNSRVTISGGNFNDIKYPKFLADNNSFINYEFDPLNHIYKSDKLNISYYPTLLNNGETYISAKHNTYLDKVMIPELRRYDINFRSELLQK